jgi:hypothetical protein
MRRVDDPFARVMVPLGYVSRDKKLLIVEGEAERVRTIFQRYLDLADE